MNLVERIASLAGITVFAGGLISIACVCFAGTRLLLGFGGAT